MFGTNQKCQIDNCHRASSTYCYCCNKSICTRHFIEHVDAVRTQIDPLADTINIMVEKVRDLTIEQLTEISLEKLNKWKSDMHQLIDEIVSNKSKEIEDLVEKNKEKFIEYKTQQLDNVMKLQEDIKELVEDGDVAFQQIKLLKEQLESIEESQVTFQRDFISIDTRVFDYGSIVISSKLNKLSITPNIQSSASQFPIPSAVNVPVASAFGSSTHQSPGLKVINPNNLSGGSMFSFGAAPATTGSNVSSFTPTASTFRDDPFSINDNSTSSRPIVKAKRRSKN